MGRKFDFIDGYMYNEDGTVVRKMDEGRGKYFAVIVMCGHCGNGYFIPAIFTTGDQLTLNSAIEKVKQMPKVKRDVSGVVLDAFEITASERFFIERINDKDAYITSKATKDDHIVAERRIPVRSTQERGKQVEFYDSINTRDKISPEHVVERFCAPVYQGDKLVYPNKINRKELLHEFFKQNTIRLGFERPCSFYPALYYQMYGENNDLGISLSDDGVLSYEYLGQRYSFKLSEGMTEKIHEGLESKEEKKDPQVLFDASVKTDDKSRPSQIDKFNRRFNKTKKILESQETGSQPGEE